MLFYLTKKKQQKHVCLTIKVNYIHAMVIFVNCLLHATGIDDSISNPFSYKCYSKIIYRRLNATSKH